jgi:hypothetical protein
VSVSKLSRRVGSADQRFAALRGLWNNHLMRVELNAARELAVQLRAAAEDTGDPERRLVAERAAGSGLMALGEHCEANAEFAQAALAGGEELWSNPHRAFFNDLRTTQLAVDVA